MVSLLAACPLWWLRSRQRVRLGLMYLLVACMIPFLAGKEIQARFMTLEHTETDASANSRWQSWSVAIRIANDYPLLGAGVRGADMVSYAYGADMKGRTIHSQYLQIAADNGWIGLALYLLMLGAVWWEVRRSRLLTRYREDVDGRRAYAIACGVEGAMAVFCVGSAFLSLEVFELPYLLLMFGAILSRVRGVRPTAEATLLYA